MSRRTHPVIPTSLVAGVAVVATLTVAPIAGAEPEVSIVLPQGSLANDSVTYGPDDLVYCTYCIFGTSTRQILRTTPEGDSEVFVSFGPDRCTLGLAFDAAGNLYAADLLSDEVLRIFPDGTFEVFASGPLIESPADLDFHPSGNGDLYVVNHTTATVTIVHPDQTMEVFHQGAPIVLPHTGTFDADGNLYVESRNGIITRFAPDGTPSALGTMPGVGYLHSTGDRLYGNVLDENQVFEISLDDGTVTVLAGSGEAGFTEGPASTAELHSPNGLTSSPDGRRLYASSGFGNGLFEIDLGPAVSVPATTPDTGSGITAKPNPFRAGTAVTLEVPGEGAVALTVFDSAGRRVRALDRTETAAGPSTISWDGRDADGAPVASGVYFARVETALGGATTRVVCVR